MLRWEAFLGGMATEGQSRLQADTRPNRIQWVGGGGPAEFGVGPAEFEVAVVTRSACLAELGRWREQLAFLAEAAVRLPKSPEVRTT